MPTPPALSETPTGDLSLPFAKAAELLAASSEFRTMVGAATPTIALASIDYPLRDVETYGWPIPGAIITDDDSLRQHTKRLPRVREGQLLLILCDEMKAQYYADGETIDWRNDDIAWRNRLGQIMSDMLERPAGGILATTGWRKVGTPTHLGPPEYQRDDPDAQRWFRYATFIIDWV